MGVYCRNRVRSLVAFALMTGGAGVTVSHAQSEHSTPVHWRLDHSVTLSELRREMLVEADIAEGWYLYSALQPPGGPIPLSFDVGVGYSLGGRSEQRSRGGTQTGTSISIARSTRGALNSNFCFSESPRGPTVRTTASTYDIRHVRGGIACLRG